MPCHPLPSHSVPATLVPWSRYYSLFSCMLATVALHVVRCMSWFVSVVLVSNVSVLKFVGDCHDC